MQISNLIKFKYSFFIKSFYSMSIYPSLRAFLRTTDDAPCFVKQSANCLLFSYQRISLNSPIVYQ